MADPARSATGSRGHHGSCTFEEWMLSVLAIMASGLCAGILQVSRSSTSQGTCVIVRA